MKFCTLAIAGAFGPGCISRKSSSLGAWSTRTMLITGRVSGVVLTTAPLWAARGRMQTIVMAEEMIQPGSRLGGAYRMQSPHFAPATWDFRRAPLWNVIDRNEFSWEAGGSPAADSDGGAESFSFA